MDNSARATIAYIAGRLVSGRRTSSVYDHGRSGYFNLSGPVSPQRVNVYDYGRSCHISGRPTNLYDYGRSCYVQLKVKPDGKFDGYDYGSSSHFSGKVSGRRVSFYDYETSSYFDYQV